jgi:hypothetical protein
MTEALELLFQGSMPEFMVDLKTGTARLLNSLNRRL